MAKAAAEKKADPAPRKKSSAAAVQEDLPTLKPAPKAKSKTKAPKEPVAAVAAPTAEAAPIEVTAPTEVAAPVKAKKGAKNSAKSAAKNKASVPTSEQRQHYISVAAYFVAERHGFAPGRDAANWAEAEAEVDSMISAGLLAD